MVWFRSQAGWQLLAVPVLCLSVAACNADSPRKAVYPVKGQVSFEGKPAPGAMVVLHPTDDAKGEPERPLGYADEAGNFQLTTYVVNDGAPAGEYAVSLVWLKQTPQKEMREAVEESTAAESVNLLPTKYADPASSGLRVQIKAGSNQLEPFQLKK
jgi:hypothetical protein